MHRDIFLTAVLMYHTPTLNLLLYGDTALTRDSNKISSSMYMSIYFIQDNLNNTKFNYARSEQFYILWVTFCANTPILFSPVIFFCHYICPNLPFSFHVIIILTMLSLVFHRQLMDAN